MLQNFSITFLFIFLAMLHNEPKYRFFFFFFLSTDSYLQEETGSERSSNVLEVTQ